MNEAVDRVLEQREAMDRGFPAGIVLSGAFHLLLAGAALGAAVARSARAAARASRTGIAVPLPPGGGGPLQPEPAPAAAPPVTTAPEPAPPAPAPEPPPKVIKPPKEEPRKGLPPPDAKKTKPKPEKSVAPRAPRGSAHAGADGAASGRRDGHRRTRRPRHRRTGRDRASPGGTDPLGDWYLAGVQRKIWTIWTRQIKTGFAQPITISLHDPGDGSLEDGSVRILQASGVQLLDIAAQRAVYSAAPFGPLPKTYGTNRITIQALFQPTP